MYIDFTLDNYRSLMEQLKKCYVVTNLRGYSVRYSNILEQLPFVILRHDVDACLESALNIATIESGEFGISSTFFFLHNSPFYNLLDSNTVEVVKEISELGHEIGFHYDCSLFDKVVKKEALLLKMIRVFEQLCEVKVSSIVCHNTSLTKQDYFLDMPMYVNAYSSTFTKDMFYVSDSAATWRKGALDELFTLPPRNSKVQLLLHPFLWNRQEYYGRKNILDELKVRKISDIASHFTGWEQAWDSYLTKYAGQLENG